MKPRAACAAAGLAAALAAAPASAVPRFAVRLGTTCSTCHVNPSGGGMRNVFGRDVFGPARLSWSAGAGLQPATGTMPPAAVGADARIAYLGIRPGPDDAAATGYRGAFFPMQADVHLAATHGPLTALADIGLLGSWEAMLMARAGPATVKAGRFMVPFGLRLDNHTVWTREPLGFGPRDKDVGIEIGAAWLWPRAQIHLQASATNGAGGEALLDDNAEKATSGRTELFVRPLPASSSVSLTLLGGGSAYRNVTGVATSTREGRIVHDRIGAFGGLGLGRFTLLGEMDAVIDDDLGAAPDREGRVRKAARFVELGAVLHRGLEAQVLYEFLDPDEAVQPNARHRLGLLVDLFPMPALAIHALLRSTGAPPGSADHHRLEALLQLHLYL